MADMLTITFDRSLGDAAGICIGRVVNGRITVLKMESGEQADILYRLLTEQTTKAEIKSESEEAEALSAEYCEDCISRQAVLDYIHESELGGYVELPTETWVETVTKMSPITPKQKMGYWEWVQYDYNPKLGNWHCSECRGIVAVCVNKEKKGGIPRYNYCPYCGAKMIKSEDTE